MISSKPGFALQQLDGSGKYNARDHAVQQALDLPNVQLNVDEEERGRLRVPPLDELHQRMVSPDALSELSVEDSAFRSRGRDSASQTSRHGRMQSKSPAPSPRSYRGWWQAFWVRNKGLCLVLMAMLFGTLMNVATRLLEVEGDHGRGMHPFQILFARMSITVLLSSLYCWYKAVPDFPFGAKQVRPLLLARGFSGFFGVFGLYYSLLYLPLADATVLTFLAPSLACWACSILINEPFEKVEQIAACVSLTGVVLIARPTALFPSFSSTDPPDNASPSDIGLEVRNVTASLSTEAATTVPSFSDYDKVTPHQRLMAVAVAMLGVLGAAGAYTTIRWIGKRAHPLITVNYFATWCTVVSTVMLWILPDIGFTLPADLKEWSYLIFLGISGFIMQFLLAAGLQYEKSSRATNMIYTQMLFALAFDKVVFGTTPGLLSITGSSLILGPAIYIAIHKDGTAKARPSDNSGSLTQPSQGVNLSNDEELGLVEGIEMHDQEERRE